MPFIDVPADLQEQVVVLDLAAPFVAIGRMVAADHAYFVLEEADLHDLRDTNTTRDHYVVDCCRVGVRPNRKRVFIRRHDVVGLALATDVEL